MVHVGKVAVPSRPGSDEWVVAWVAFVAGIAASLAANIAHADVSLGAKAIAGWAPLALLLCAEVVMRVPAPRSWILRTVRLLATLAVAGVAALASYRHMRDLALEYGEDWLTAATLPLSADGLIIVASIALFTLAQERRRAIAAEALALQAAPPGAPVPPVDEPVPDRGATPPGADRPAPAAPAVADPPADPVPMPLPVPEPDRMPLPAPDPVAEPAPEPVPLPVPDPEPPAAVAEALPLPEPEPRPDDDQLPFGFEPVLSRLDAATRQLYVRAYRRYLDSVAAGSPLTGAKLGQHCGRGERWGRDRIAEVRAAQQRAAEAKELTASAAGGM